MMGYVNITLAGILTGAAYSIIAVSLTLMFRSTGVLSFAHAAFAMVGAYVFADLADGRGWPLPVAFVAAVGITVAYGLLVERIAIRPVAHGSGVMKLIVTLGVLSLTTGLTLLRYGFEPTGAPLLLPPGAITIGELNVTYQQLAIFLTAGGTALGLGWFLARTRFGIAVRAVAQNRDVARLMGVSLNKIAGFNWALGAGLAAVAGILIAPLSVLTVATFPVLLGKALTAALFGGLMSLPLTFVGGLAVGVVEGVTTLQSTAPGARELAVLVLVLVLLFVRRSWATDIDEGARLADAPRRLALPGWLRAGAARARALAAGLRPLTLSLLALAAVVAVVVPARSEFWGFVGAVALVFALQSLSLVLLVGWGGQVSLMHGAYVGIGAFAAAYLVQRHDLPLEIAIPLAAGAGMVLGAIAGLPALRLSGLQFAIASLAFAAAAAQWLFRRPGLSRQLPREELFGLDLFSSSNVFIVMVPVTVLVYLLVWNVRRSSFGALLLAARDAPQTVAHFGAHPERVRMAAFLLASFIAALGGAFFGLLLTSFNPANFGVTLSIALLLYAVIGGIHSLAGPIFAALVFGVLPQVLQGEAGAQASAWPEILTGVLVIVLAASAPAGLASLVRPQRPAAAATPAPEPDRRLVTGRFQAALAAYPERDPERDDDPRPRVETVDGARATATAPSRGQDGEVTE